MASGSHSPSNGHYSANGYPESHPPGTSFFLVFELGRLLMCSLNVFHRNDVGLAAAELALAVEQHVLASGSIDTVGTTGRSDPHVSFCRFCFSRTDFDSRHVSA